MATGEGKGKMRRAFKGALGTHAQEDHVCEQASVHMPAALPVPTRTLCHSQCHEASAFDHLHMHGESMLTLRFPSNSAPASLDLDSSSKLRCCERDLGFQNGVFALTQNEDKGTVFLLAVPSFPLLSARLNRAGPVDHLLVKT